MKRREALRNISTFVALPATGLGYEAISEAQQQAKVAKIGWLGPGGFGSGPELLKQELRLRGYVEGKNFAIEYRFAESKLDRLPALADELVRLKVDLIIVSDPNAALAAKNATKTIPIVLTIGVDPVAAGGG